MKRKYEIWFNSDNDDTGMLIPVGEIEQKIATFGDETIYRLDETATDERIAELNKLEENWRKEYIYHWSRQSDVETFFEENGIKYETHSDDYYISEGKIVYCQGEFSNENIFDTFAIYTWWDGSNWKDVERPEPSEDGCYEEVEFDDTDEKCLDEWDGSNYQSGGTGMHDYMVRLGDDRILMIYRSQWEGDHTEAIIFTEAEYQEYRKNRKLDD